MLPSATMNILKVHGCYRLQPPISHLSQNIHPSSLTTHHKSKLCHVSSPSIHSSNPQFRISRTNSNLRNVRVSEIGAPLWTQKDDKQDNSGSPEDLTMNGEAYQKTLRLVECSMFAALGGLAYILSSSLAIENYFGCFFALPIVFSSMRWDIVAGRKTMVSIIKPKPIIITIFLKITSLSFDVFHFTYHLFVGGNCYTIACFSWTHKSTNISVDAWVSWSCYGIFMEVKSKLGCFYIHKCNCESYRCNGICCDVFFSNQGKHSCFDHYKHSCFSYIYSHFIRVLDNSINEFNIRHFWDFAITELLFLCVLATSSICSVLYKAWNEGFFEITKMVC